MTSCLKKPEGDNQFRVGMECTYSPFNWSQQTDENGGIPVESGGFAGGYDVEIAKIVAKNLGKELVIVKIDWDGLLPALTSGKIDTIIGGMTPTPIRRYTIDFSDPYYISNIVMVVKKNGPFANATSLDDFEGAKITGQLGTIPYQFIDQINNVKKLPAKEDFPSMVVALGAGEIDGYISELPGALSAVYTNSNLTYIEFEQGKGFNISDEERSVAMGFKKNNPLKDEVNKILSNISSEEKKKLMKEAVKNQPSTFIN